MPFPKPSRGALGRVLQCSRDQVVVRTGGVRSPFRSRSFRSRSRRNRWRQGYVCWLLRACSIRRTRRVRKPCGPHGDQGHRHRSIL